ncbi:MAG: transcription termination factor NusA [Candidatus Gastranaerophilaceae bacterium]|jgi:N utilization substance protein A
MIKFGSAFFDAVEQLEREKGISRSIILQSICDAMVTAYKKQIKDKVAMNVKAIINEKPGEIGIFREKTVVNDVEDENIQITLKDAKKINPEAKIDDIVDIEVTPADFGRIAAQSAKQVITQRIREAERNLIINEFMEKKGTLITGTVQRVESRNVIVNIGRSEAIMPQREQIPGEYYRVNSRIRVYVLDVKETTRLPQVIVSQVHPKIVQELFELEVPEIEDGIVEIKNISREAGYRTKIAVSSSDPEIDPVGACIGPRGSRIQTIVNELKNEKIDIIRYSDDPVTFIVNALSPAKIISVDILEESETSREALVVVPDDQLSLAIGIGGQNVRLAHRLTGWKIDIKSLSQVESSGYYDQQYDEEAEQEETTEENEVSAEEPTAEDEK